MKILVIEPLKPPAVREIEDTLSAMQAVVGGPIQAVYPFDAPVALICHEEGKLLGLPWNRTLREPETGAVYDIVCGTCFLCGAPPDSDCFSGLKPGQLDYYKAYYREPELFLQTDSGLLILRGGKAP